MPSNKNVCQTIWPIAISAVVTILFYMSVLFFVFVFLVKTLHHKLSSFVALLVVKMLSEDTTNNFETGKFVLFYTV